VYRLSGGAPAVLNGDRDEPVCVDPDASRVTAHSHKDGAAGRYKGGFGFCANMAFLDRGRRRRGARRDPACGQRHGERHQGQHRPARGRVAGLPGLPEGTALVVRGDSGLATKTFLGYARQAGCRFSVSFDLSEVIKAAIHRLPEHAWQPAVRQTAKHEPAPRSPSSPSASPCPTAGPTAPGCWCAASCGTQARS
jgi:hypothetical protein